MLFIGSDATREKFNRVSIKGEEHLGQVAIWNILKIK